MEGFDKILYTVGVKKSMLKNKRNLQYNKTGLN